MHIRADLVESRAQFVVLIENKIVHEAWNMNMKMPKWRVDRDCGCGDGGGGGSVAAAD